MCMQHDASARIDMWLSATDLASVSHEDIDCTRPQTSAISTPKPVMLRLRHLILQAYGSGCEVVATFDGR